MPDISFVVMVNNDEIFQSTFLTSPIFTKNKHQIIVKKNAVSAALAYNQGLQDCLNDIIVFAHQDIFFPEEWDNNLFDIIAKLERANTKWGVLGCIGVTINNKITGYAHCNVNKLIGIPQEPVETNSLDEIVLIINKNSNLMFDYNLPGFHLYGTDICLESLKMGYKNYVISNLCIHNNFDTRGKIPESFWHNVRFIKQKWNKHLPIQTTCFKIEKNIFKHFLKRSKILKNQLKIRYFTSYKTNNHLTTTELFDLNESIKNKYLSNKDF